MSSLSLLDTDDELDLRDAVRRLLADRVDRAASIRMYDGDRSDGSALWGAVAGDLGVAGMLVPADLGGGGGSAREAAVVLEELGRACAPVPFLTSSIIATSLLLEPAVLAHGRDVLSDAAVGRRTLALVFPLSAATAAQTVSIPLETDGLLTGEVRSVAGALEADDLLVPVSTGSGTAVVLVSAEDVDRQPVASLDMTRPLADVRLRHTRGVTVIEPPHGDRALSRALALGAGLLAAEQVGVASWCLDATIEHLKTRRQFGRALGSFQALKHRVADLYVAIETASAAARTAAAALAAGDSDAPTAVAVAQAWCSDVAVLAAEEAVQLHGGIGMTWEHPVHLYLKRAKADQIALGTPGHHRLRLAELAGLPPAGSATQPTQ